MDDGFSPSTNTFLTISALIRQPNGKVIVAGKFKNVFESGIIRLNEDGTMDSNFIRGEGTAGTVSSVALQSDEKILIAGAFFSFNGVGKINLVRLKTDGTMDFGFTATRMTNISQTLRSISVEPDGKILLVVTEAGFYDHLVRLNQDGGTDTSFTSPLSSISALTVGGDGRIYAMGVNNQPGGNLYSKLYRLNPDGSVDSQFVPIEIGLVSALALEPDRLSLLLAGHFIRVNGVPRTSLARIFTVAQPSLTAADYGGGTYRFLLTGETNRMYRIDASTTLLDWLALGTVSLINSLQPFVDSNGTSFTRRFYRAVAIH